MKPNSRGAITCWEFLKKKKKGRKRGKKVSNMIKEERKKLDYNT
jgi:hypothetical protein